MVRSRKASSMNPNVPQQKKKQNRSMKLSLLLIAAVAFAVCSVSDGKVMMEYIGNRGLPIRLDGIPIEPNITFHFILAFAVDANSSGEPQNGYFAPYWPASITPAAVRSVKARHHNVKVLAGIFANQKVGWYKMHDRDTWITNAFNSIQSMITKYHLDGIDIDYEMIPKDDETTFVYCMGQLITRLKIHRVITVATISPNRYSARHYIHLYRSYPSVIDYVNYQFYTDGAKTPKAYLRYYRIRSTQFYGPKLLPDYEVNTTGIQEDAFFEAMRLLESNGYHINGLVIFSADASKSTGYNIEKKAQAFLLGKK